MILILSVAWSCFTKSSAFCLVLFVSVMFASYCINWYNIALDTPPDPTTNTFLSLGSIALSSSDLANPIASVLYPTISSPKEIFILVYIKQMNARDEIQDFLHSKGYEEGKSYLLVS